MNKIEIYPIYKVIMTIVVISLSAFCLSGCQKHQDTEKTDASMENPVISEYLKEESYELNKELKGAIAFATFSHVDDYSDTYVAVIRKSALPFILPEINGRVIAFYNGVLYLSSRGSIEYVDLTKGNGNYQVSVLADIGSSEISAAAVVNGELLYHLGYSTIKRIDLLTHEPLIPWTDDALFSHIEEVWVYGDKLVYSTSKGEINIADKPDKIQNIVHRPYPDIIFSDNQRLFYSYRKNGKHLLFVYSDDVHKPFTQLAPQCFIKATGGYIFDDKNDLIFYDGTATKVLYTIKADFFGYVTNLSPLSEGIIRIWYVSGLNHDLTIIDYNIKTMKAKKATSEYYLDSIIYIT